MRIFAKLLAAILVIGGIGCIQQGLMSVLGNAQAEPQRIRCAALSDSGPGSNGHVTITEFHACTDLIVVAGGDGKAHWDECFIPLVAASNPNNRNFVVLLDSFAIHDRDTLAKLNSRESITGVINGSAQGPGEKAKTLLVNSYPGVDLDKCYVVHQDMTAISKPIGAVLLVAGVVLLGGFVVVIKKMPPAKASAAPEGPVSAKF